MAISWSLKRHSATVARIRPLGLILTAAHPILSLQIRFCPHLQADRHSSLPCRGNGAVPPCWTWPGHVPGLFLAKTTVWRSAVPPRHAIEALSLLAAEPRLCRRYLELPYVLHPRHLEHQLGPPARRVGGAVDDRRAARRLMSAGGRRCILIQRLN